MALKLMHLTSSSSLPYPRMTGNFLDLPLIVADELRDYDIVDAKGKTVARAAHGDLKLAKAIALAINEGEFLKNLVRKLAAIVHDEYDGTDWYRNLLDMADEVAGRGKITVEDMK